MGQKPNIDYPGLSGLKNLRMFRRSSGTLVIQCGFCQGELRPYETTGYCRHCQRLLNPPIDVSKMGIVISGRSF